MQGSESQGQVNEISAPPLEQTEPELSPEQQKVNEYQDLLQRTKADFVNYRRRMNQEQTESRLVAQSELLSALFPVLDDLGRALAAAPPEQATQPWVQGLVLVARRLATQLEQVGVRQIGAPGEHFDPRKHEAITTEEHTNTPEGTIVQVLRPGYALGERVIRPGQVIVAQHPSPPRETPAPQKDQQIDAM